MTITSVTAIPITHVDHQGLPLNYLFIRLENDDGVIGYGEVCDSYACTHPLSVAAIIDEALAPLLLNENVDDVERLAFKMRGWTRRRMGDQGVIIQAISGLEIALWDLAGKSVGKSVSQMLGKKRDQIPVYASGTFLEEGSADWHFQLFEPCLKQRVKAVKVRLGLDYTIDLQTLKTLRGLIDRKVDMMVDGSEHYCVETALQIANSLADAGVLFFEEPVPQHLKSDIERLVEASPVPIAYGEHLFTRQDFEDCLNRKRADVIQPDAAICGGIAEAIEAAKLAKAFGARVAPHSAAGPLALAANIHFCASAPDIWMLEYAFTLDSIWSALMPNPILSPTALRDGCLPVPDGPGLGIQINESVWESNPYRPAPAKTAMPTWSVGKV